VIDNLLKFHTARVNGKPLTAMGVRYRLPRCTFPRRFYSERANLKTP
jgi:hypothetical protein